MRTEKQLAQHREAMRRYRAMHPEKVWSGWKAWRDANPEKRAAAEKAYRERNGDLIAYRKFLARHAKPEQQAEYRATWEKANPEKARKQQRNKPSAKRRQQRRSRLKHIATAKDQVALGKRIAAYAEAAIPARIYGEPRIEVRSRLIEAVYAGRFPIRLTQEHALEVVAEHFRLFNKFVEPVSLDAPLTDDGATLHNVVSKGLWQ